MQTLFGKGVVREVRNHGRLLVDVQGRALVVREADVTTLDTDRKASRPARAHDAEPAPPAHPPPGTHAPAAEIDLHGLTVEESLARAESALNEALPADVEVLRLIHGRSGGRIRAALHRRLRELPSVRGFPGWRRLVVAQSRAYTPQSADPLLVVLADDFRLTVD